MTTGADATAVTVGVDLGGTGTRVVAVTSDGAVAGQASTGTERGPDHAVESLTDLIVGALPPGGLPHAVGIGASGPIDAAGIIRNPHTLPGYTAVDLVGALRDRFGVPVLIDNDAVTAALYETRRGAARRAHSALVVTLGTGVGVCAITHGRPVRGADGTHPEAGHLSMTGIIAPCYCGRPACWEQAASRSALQASSASACTRPTGTAADIRTAFDSAGDGDEAARRVFEEYGCHVAAGLADLLTVHRTEYVVLGGSAVQFQDAFLPTVRDRLSRVHDCFPTPHIVISDSDEYAGAIGAATLPAVDRLGETRRL